MPVFNCHVHTFTVKHVPENFLPGIVRWLLEHGWSRWLLLKLCDWADPFDKRDMLQRYANFVRVGEDATQRQVFDIVAARYEPGTVFVVLPMDMAYMHAGPVPVPLRDQHFELGTLAQAYPGRILPFFAVDPRRPGVLDELKEFVEQRGFRGVKLYPNLGYSPQDPALEPILAYAEENRLPVLAHCSRGGVHDKHLSRAAAAQFADPRNYLPILAAHPRLRLCLAHFGGDDAWQEFVAARAQGMAPPADNWVVLIHDLLRAGTFPNLYTDVSYTIFDYAARLPILQEFLADPNLRTHVLFGSDYYMIEQERFEEKRLIASLRRDLAPDIFKLLTEDNPRRFLE
jgi:predicted TIM-barrel fold metal-dependent hydrolase